MIFHDFVIVELFSRAENYLCWVETEGTDLARTSSYAQDVPAGALPRNEEGLAMWATLFAVTTVIAVALSMAAIVVDSANGGKFRL